MHIITAITGASGSIYAKRFVQEVNRLGHEQSLLVSDPAWQVMEHELGLNLPETKIVKNIEHKFISSWELEFPDLISYESITNINASIASGSRAPEAMVVIPCTMGTTARLNQGLSSNLLERAFDVMLKEKKKLIIVPRETPFNQIHLKNMLELSRMDVDIIPAMPGFYHKPKNICELVDYVVGRVLEHLSLKHSLYNKWSGD